MKKTVKIISAICAIVMLIGLLPIMSVSAEDPAAEATLVVTPSAEKVMAGKTFKLTVSIKNNPGLGGINFLLPIDTDAFEFVEYKFGDVVASGAGVSGYNEGKGFVLNRTSGDGFTELSGDKEIVIITLRAKADADLGKYTFATTIDAKNTVDISGALYAVADASTEVEIIEYATVSTIDSASIMLGTDISVKYYATLDVAHAGAQMKFTFNGRETVVDGEATDKANEYAYTFKGIAPQCMGDNLKAELIVNGVAVAEKATYSILENCNNLLSKNAAELDLTDAQYAAMKPLIADLLVYGAKAQLFKEYKTGSLVDANVTGATALGEISDDDNVMSTDYSESDTIAIFAAGVYFDYVNSIFCKFTAPDVTAENFTIVWGTYNSRGKQLVLDEFTLDDCDLIDEATSAYMFFSPELSVLDYGTTFYVELQIDGEYIHYLDYSVNSYAYAMQDNENTAMADLAKALYNYGVSATAFLEA